MNLFNLLQEAPGKIHTTTDGWSEDTTSAAFLGSTAHWIEVMPDRWNLRSEVIGFRGLSGQHSGHNLARNLLGVYERVDIITKESSKVRET